jgi:hypothetical protein
MRDLRAHDVDMLTIGQYLQPSAHHLPVLRYWTPDEFKAASNPRHGDGLHPRRVRSAGALVLPRRPHGDGRRFRLMPDGPRDRGRKHTAAADEAVPRHRTCGDGLRSKAVESRPE